MSLYKNYSELFFCNDKKCIDKWEHYLSIYESEMSRFIRSAQPIRLLEIGVQNGGSLELWEKILPEGSTIIGIDIEKKITDLSFKNSRIGVACVDATDSEAIKQLFSNRQFDIIIDDGSHLPKDVIKSFSIFFEYLAPCGKYIVEDLHCSYYESYGGGYKAKESSIEYFKNVVDVLNFDHIIPTENIDKNVASFLSKYSQLVSKIVFYDSLCVVSKLSHRKTRPYKRVRSGAQDIIQPYKSWIPLASLDEIDATIFNIDAKNLFDKNLIEMLHEYKKNEHELRLVTDNQDNIINSQKEIIDCLKREIKGLIEKNLTSMPDQLGVTV